MERKVHWAWPSFTTGLVPAERLHIHLEQEYATYVRDSPLRDAIGPRHAPLRSSGPRSGPVV